MGMNVIICAGNMTFQLTLRETSDESGVPGRGVRLDKGYLMLQSDDWTRNECSYIRRGKLPCLCYRR